MAGERTVPILPCRDVDEILEFYAMLGFERTYRQLRPYPCVAVRRGEIDFQFAGIDGFDAAGSYGSCLLVTSDADALYRAWSEGLRAGLGRVPTAGIPRVTRPRRRNETVYGFSVVDPGGNWIRVVQPAGAAGAAGDDAATKAKGLAKALEAAVTLGDSKGDPALAAETLDRALAKFSEAPAAERVPALAYRVELAVALGDREAAAAAVAAARAVLGEGVPADELAADIERAEELPREGFA